MLIYLLWPTLRDYFAQMDAFAIWKRSSRLLGCQAQVNGPASLVGDIGTFRKRRRV